MFPATCANCGKACQVPFRPSGEKPVYCNDCFGNPKLHGGGNAPRDFGNEQAATSRAPEKDTRIDDLKRQVDAMQSKLDKVLQILEASARPQPLAQPTEVPMRTTKAKKQGVTPKKVAKKRK
jgi:CxxC-x17-CxxC domain-containing protein